MRQDYVSYVFHHLLGLPEDGLEGKKDAYVLVDEQDGNVRSLGELLKGSLDGGRLSLYNPDNRTSHRCTINLSVSSIGMGEDQAWKWWGGGEAI
jgi:hypothetical protein